MYFKCVHYLMEAYLDKTLTPYERVYKAYYCKTFFVTWYENCERASQFISYQCYKDLKCCADGLIMYLLTLMTEFPSAPVVTCYVGTDSNEQAFAFIRIGCYAGRRTHLDTLIMAHGLEKLNIRSLMPGHEPFQIAQTRGRHVLKPAVLLPNEICPEMNTKIGSSPMWYGRDIDAQILRNSMKNAINECILDCQKLKLPFFMNAEPDRIPSTTLRARGFSEQHDEEEFDV